MQTDPEFLSTLNRFEFAYYGPDMDKAIKVKFPLVEFDKMPQMTEAQYDEMRAENRRKYAYVRPVTPQTPTTLQAPPTTPAPLAPLQPSAEPEDHDDGGGVGWKK
jgi:hypothetical protein